MIVNDDRVERGGCSAAPGAFFATEAPDEGAGTTLSGPRGEGFHSSCFESIDDRSRRSGDSE